MILVWERGPCRSYVKLTKCSTMIFGELLAKLRRKWKVFSRVDSRKSKDSTHHCLRTTFNSMHQLGDSQTWRDQGVVRINLSDQGEGLAILRDLEVGMKVNLLVEVSYQVTKLLPPLVVPWNFSRTNSYKMAQEVMQIWLKASEHTSNKNNSLHPSTATTQAISSKV